MKILNYFLSPLRLCGKGIALDQFFLENFFLCELRASAVKIYIFLICALCAFAVKKYE